MKKIILYVALGIIPLLFSQCTLKDDLNNLQSSLDSVQVYLGSPKFETSVHVVFVDTKTNERITNKDITVTVGGKDGNSVYNNIGTRQVQYAASSGALDLVVDPHLNNSVATNPLTFTLSTSVKGYASVNQDIEITEAKRSYVTVPLISLANPPTGVTVITEQNIGTTDSKGKLTQEKLIQFAPKQKAASSNHLTLANSITIPPGIILLDKNGEALVGNVSAEAWFDNFQSGVFKTLINPTGYYRTYANLGIQLTVSGGAKSGVVAWVEGADISYKVSFPNNYLKPPTNTAIAVGTEFPRVATINGLGNTTTLETANDKVVSDNNAMVLKFASKALSIRWSERVSAVCQNGPKFNFVIANDENDAPLFRHIVKQGNVTVLSTTEKVSKATPILQSSYLPDGQATHVFESIGSAANNEVEWVLSPASFNNINSCTSQVYTVTATKKVNAASKFLEIDIDFKVTSESSNQLVIKPNVWLDYNKEGSTSSSQTEMKQGIVTFHNILISTPSSKYIVGVAFGDQYYTGKMEVTPKTNGDFSIKFGFDDFDTIDITATPTGAGTTKKVAINYTLALTESDFNQIKL